MLAQSTKAYQCKTVKTHEWRETKETMKSTEQNSEKQKV